MNEDIVKMYWNYMSNAEFDMAGTLMNENAVVWMPNTREVFKGRDFYVEFNKKYPGHWIISIEKILSIDNDVITAVKVSSKNGKESFYATSFFRINNNLIEEITEYWGENGEPPEWRLKEKLSEKY
jgi:predicted SnoaL-like aldol condensation-catalyzing enzyme